MARTSTERLVQQQHQPRFPRVLRRWCCALSRWVMGACLAGSANGPALAPPTTGAPPRQRASGVAPRVIRLLQRGKHQLRWLLAHRRWWVRLWVRPEPLPKRGDRITMHMYTPSQCLKSP